MQIDSTKVHEILNDLAINREVFNINTAEDALKVIRDLLINLESETACNKAKESSNFKALRDHADKFLFLLGQATMFLMEIDHSLELPPYQRERIKNLLSEVGEVCYGEIRRND